MSALTKIEWLILNETADDAENLEQIYRALSFEFCPIHDQSRRSDGGYWRESDSPILLADIADAIRSLVERKLLIVRQDPADPLGTNDLSYVWRSWFEPSPEGRALCSADEVKFADKQLSRSTVAADAARVAVSGD